MKSSVSCDNPFSKSHLKEQFKFFYYYSIISNTRFKCQKNTDFGTYKSAAMERSKILQCETILAGTNSEPRKKVLCSRVCL